MAASMLSMGTHRQPSYFFNFVQSWESAKNPVTDQKKKKKKAKNHKIV